MRTIYKYPFNIGDRFVVSMPAGAVVLSCQVQAGTPCLWAMVETDRPPELRVFGVFGTGHPLPADLGPDSEFLGTLVMGRLVWHVWELKP